MDHNEEQINNEEQPFELPVGFEQFGFRKEIMKGIEAAGFKVPSPIQAQAIPHIMAGKDIIGQAQTGTGKTAAFGLPAMNALNYDNGVDVLVITPTRELASQVSDELFNLGRFAGVKTVAVYGGQSIRRQVDLIQRGAQVVTATPGRLLDHLQSGRLEDFKPSIVILDEADEMLDMGFLDDIMDIFRFLPGQRQTLLFSATMPPAIRTLAKKILQDPVTVNITTPGESTTNKDITQKYYLIEEREREDALIRLMDTEVDGKSIIFCRTKKETDELSTSLVSRGYSAKALHGDMEQRQRTEAIDSFKRGKVEVMVATDVAARGLDISDVTFVINYHIPFDPESYVHRIGRTGRAGKKGTAVTLVTPLEYKELGRIKGKMGAPIENAMLPTIKEAKERLEDKLIADILHQELDGRAAEVLAKLEEEQDMHQIACRLISALMEKKSLAGPNRIGLDAEAIARFIERNKHGGGGGGRGGYRKGGGGGYRGNRGNRSGGGGGGYRGNRGGGDRDRRY